MKYVPSRLARLVVLAIAACSAGAAPADDSFLANLSKLVTRAARKELPDKSFPFTQGPLTGRLQAVEPESRLQLEVRDFSLTDDLVVTSVAGAGRFQIEGQVDGRTDIRAVFDVKLAITAEARFVKEADRYYVEPKVTDLTAELSIIEASPADLAGIQDLLSGIVTTGLRQNKQKIIAEVNKRLGKRAL